jgi:hypothetical protein
MFSSLPSERRARQWLVEISEDDPHIVAARKRGSRYLTIVFGAFAIAFIVISVAELIGAVFGVGLPIAGVTAPSNLPAGSCVERLKELQAAVDRAVASASRATSDDEAAAAYRRALSPEWDEARAGSDPCAADAPSQDALAAVVRLRRAGEEVARRQAVELGPLRQDVAAYLARRPPSP